MIVGSVEYESCAILPHFFTKHEIDISVIGTLSSFFYLVIWVMIIEAFCVMLFSADNKHFMPSQCI